MEIPIWGWIIIGLLAILIFKLAAFLLGFVVLIMHNFAKMSLKEKQEIMHKVHMMQHLKHISQNKNKHK